MEQSPEPLIVGKWRRDTIVRCICVGPALVLEVEGVHEGEGGCVLQRVGPSVGCLRHIYSEGVDVGEMVGLTNVVEGDHICRG